MFCQKQSSKGLLVMFVPEHHLFGAWAGLTHGCYNTKQGIKRRPVLGQLVLFFELCNREN
jgi:hypothetical protein